jgi:hypothetical protein
MMTSAIVMLAWIVVLVAYAALLARSTHPDRDAREPAAR